MNIRYIVERSEQRSDRLATHVEVEGFLDACGLQRESQAWQAALAGNPIDVDGGNMRFTPVNLADASNVPASWIVHAYPLKQVVVRLQGTRHSDREAIIWQLETVLARLRAGDARGAVHDDDFGYSFELIEAVNGPSFFEEPADSN